MRSTLNEIAESVDYGVTACSREEPVGPKFLRITDIQDGRVDWDNVPWCDGDGKKLETARLQSGDIVFARTGATTGKSFLITDCPDKAVFASYLIRVRLGERADPGYVSHFFQTADYWNQITKSARGVAQPGVNATTLKSLQIPLPPLVEQQRIAGILDAADALRATRREALAQLDTLLQSTFLDMFGDPVTNPMKWDTSFLGELGKVQTGSTPPSKFDGMFDGGIPFVTPGDLRETWTDSMRTVTESGAKESRTVERGATLVCCIGATIGKMGKASQLSAFNQQINAVSWGSRIENNFGLELMRFFKAKIAKDGASTTLPILKKSLFEKIAVPVPPLPLQGRFAAIVESVEQQKNRMLAHLAELDALFACLQSRAFNGEL